MSEGGAGGSLERLASSNVAPEVRRIAAELLPVFYGQLKHIASRVRARLGAGNTMQTTALVHEAYLRLGQSRDFTDEAHFLRAAALAMRHALINYAAARVADKRGGGGVHVTLSHAAEFSVDTDAGLLTSTRRSSASRASGRAWPTWSSAASSAATARRTRPRALGLSLRTVQRDWLKARAWLFASCTAA